MTTTTTTPERKHPSKRAIDAVRTALADAMDSHVASARRLSTDESVRMFDAGASRPLTPAERAEYKHLADVASTIAAALRTQARGPIRFYVDIAEAIMAAVHAVR